MNFCISDFKAIDNLPFSSVFLRMLIFFAILFRSRKDWIKCFPHLQLLQLLDGSLVSCSHVIPLFLVLQLLPQLLCFYPLLLRLFKLQGNFFFLFVCFCRMSGLFRSYRCWKSNAAELQTRNVPLTCLIFSFSCSGVIIWLIRKLCLKSCCLVFISDFCILGRRFFSIPCLVSMSSSFLALTLLIWSSSCVPQTRKKKIQIRSNKNFSVKAENEETLEPLNCYEPSHVCLAFDVSSGRKDPSAVFSPTGAFRGAVAPPAPKWPLLSRAATGASAAKTASPATLPFLCADLPNASWTFHNFPAVVPGIFVPANSMSQPCESPF